MANELVKVELIANPGVTRTMTAATFRQNQNRWRIQGSKAPEPVVIQKKSVEAAVDEFPQIEEPIVTNAIESGLRAQYKAIFGKEAGKNWTVETISKKIKENEV